MFTATNDFLLTKNQSFHGSTTTNCGIGDDKIGNCTTVCQIDHIQEVYEIYFSQFEKPSSASMTLKYHPPQLPNLVLPFFDFKLSFPSHCNNREDAITSDGKELQSFLHSGGFQLNNFKIFCQETTKCCTIVECEHLNDRVLLITCHHEVLIFVLPCCIPTFSTK